MEDDFPILSPAMLNRHSWYNLDHVVMGSGLQVGQTASAFVHLLHFAKTILKHDPSLVQVMLNDQGKRDCAHFRGGDCVFPDDLQRSGWARVLDIIDANVGKPVRIPYHLHEFGLNREFSSRLHGFGFWPGFSLNPAVWNMDVLKEQFAVDSVARPHGNYFDEEFSLFEMVFSTVLWLKGVQVAYLEALICENIGMNSSSYVLNGVTRGAEL
jgi:hypothetical protein